MNIPESSHQIVANLIAFAALIITAIVSIFSIKQALKARRLSDEANKKMDSANKIAIEAYKLTLREHLLQSIPNLQFRYEFVEFYEHPDDKENDDVRFILTNTTKYKAEILSIDPQPPFTLTTQLGGEIKYPFYLGVNESETLLIRFSPALKKTFHIRGDNSRTKFESHIINSKVLVKYKNEFKQSFKITLLYNYSILKHVGEPEFDSKN